MSGTQQKANPADQEIDDEYIHVYAVHRCFYKHTDKIAVGA